jgi:hypothetical protein
MSRANTECGRYLANKKMPGTDTLAYFRLPSVELSKKVDEICHQNSRKNLHVEKMSGAKTDCNGVS